MNEKQQGNGMAVASMVLGIIAICSCGGYGITAILGIVFGAIGISKAKQTGVGGGMAKAGLILSIISIALIFVFIFSIAGLIWAANSTEVYTMALSILF
ncbi:MAG: DUF4190 domain-containing protein [Firmicutes bacterium]|nr:DUF4190 domain-containing protein [Bacillota bacterium]